MKSIKLAIIALLGFSTACSTVKEGSKSKKKESEKVEVAPSIVVMYGVRRPIDNEVKKSDTPITEDKKPSTESTTNTENK